MPKQKPKKVGRPKLAKGEAKGRIVPVRFRDEDLKRMESAAKANGQKLSEWIRHALQGALVFVFALLLGIWAGRASSVVFPTNAQMQKDMDEVTANRANAQRRGVILDRNGERIRQDQRLISN